jgi:hypothetical protein
VWSQNFSIKTDFEKEYIEEITTYKRYLQNSSKEGRKSSPFLGGVLEVSLVGSHLLSLR